MIHNYEEVLDALKTHGNDMEDPETQVFCDKWHHLTETRHGSAKEVLAILDAFDNSPFSDHSVWYPFLWKLQIREYDLNTSIFVMTNGAHLPDTKSISEIPDEAGGFIDFEAVISVTHATAFDLKAWLNESPDREIEDGYGKVYNQIPKFEQDMFFQMDNVAIKSWQ